MRRTTGKLRTSMTFFLGLTLVGWVSSVSAGPVIIDGTDSDDHGSATGGANPANLTGWLYIQKGFENLAPNVGNAQPNRCVSSAVIGVTLRQAIQLWL